MNKKLILIILMLASFTLGAFGQTDFASSAKSMATVGEFSSSSDDVVANKIANVKDTFLSFDYQSQLVGVGTISTFWANPIRHNMTLGIAGEYTINSLRSEDYTITDTGLVSTSQMLDENSSFNFRPVFRYYNFGLHYRISRNGNKTKDIIKETDVISGDLLNNETKEVDGSLWEHEFAVYYENDSFNMYIPVGVIMNMNSSKTISTNINGTTITELISNGRNLSDNSDGIGSVSLYVNPEFAIPMETGAMTQIKIGFNSAFDIYNSGNAYEITESITTDSSTTETLIVAESKEQYNLALAVYVNPSLEWSAWENKMDMALDITGGVKYAYNNSGVLTTTTTITKDGATTTDVDEPSISKYNSIISPYFDIAFGSLIRPFNWLEIRTGVAYGFEWLNSIDTTSYHLVGGGNINTANSAITSSVDIAAGVGFIIGQDFFIDAYMQAGRSVDVADDFSSTTVKEFGLTSLGAQLTYRF